jgi:hypothetical protein
MDGKNECRREIPEMERRGDRRRDNHDVPWIIGSDMSFGFN